MIQQLLEPIDAFLQCTTPDAWIEKARQPQQLTSLLIDHCNCELKAAQTAMFVVRKYAITKDSTATLMQWAKPYEDYVYRCIRDVAFPEKSIMQSASLTVKDNIPHGQDLVDKMVRLIKEEFHHFEQVLDIMQSRDIAYQNMTAGTYAKGMMKMVRTYEPQALIDKLIIGAYIEARSCERFAKLAPFLDDELNKFYVSLLRSEARHYQDYLSLAAAIAGEDISERVTLIGLHEAQLIQAPDSSFRFHSGSPTE
ncbi:MULTISPECIES: tRNA isopentenyl-2-thiomethyl-A-37 hydroxylase MiaE [Vibrio]|uniref:tRNA-(Ms[2]io[6]A)-hydroxylase n=1 Tax=Vibrio algicola TaxID=2662262 RepID=A0A5Q0TFZ0_9VIBR|nr:MULTISPECIES: tRNA isopentenyl-2-thiomethyl-A-37 hydroxylase MiaE [Vibrio]MBD1575450.1 tRNA-(ms[2]io[6]A)-hydroxylase [Vibrio sp. S11_S32]